MNIQNKLEHLTLAALSNQGPVIWKITNP
jgi:hypothetical protein